jgi:hypothetical protein
VLFIAINPGDFSTGKTYSVVAYLWTFVTSIEYLPDLPESHVSLKEIQERVRQEAPAPNGPSRAETDGRRRATALLARPGGLWYYFSIVFGRCALRRLV